MFWIQGLLRDLKTWRKVRQIFKKYKSELVTAGYRIDWIGRIYTVINRDFRIRLGSEADHIMMVDETQRFDKELDIYGLTSLLKVMYMPIESETENSYLVVFTPGNPGKSYVKPWHYVVLPILTISVLACIIFSLVRFL